MNVLFDRFGDIRAGWRLLACLILMVFVVTVALYAWLALPGRAIHGQSLAVLLAVLLSSWIMTRFVNRKPLAAIGLGFGHGWWKELAAGAILGLMTMGCVVLTLAATGGLTLSLRDLSPSGGLWIAVSAAAYMAMVALAEEVVFRGYLFQTLTQAVTLLPSSLIMSGLFLFAHSWNPSAGLLAFVNLGLAGLLFSAAYARTRRLWLPAGIHWGWNYAQGTLSGLPTSGIVAEDRALMMATTHEPGWWTGGAFGPEGGAAATVFVVALLWYVLVARRFSVQPGVVTLDSIEDLIAIPRN